LETRGEKGYVASFPGKGYEVIQNRFRDIPSISKEERELILSSAREFDEIIKKASIPSSSLKNIFNIKRDSTALTSWEDFDKRGHISDILNEAGWTKVSEDSEREYWKRPGQSSTRYSGNYLKSLGCFKSFSSSTALEPERAYYPYALYAMLIHNGSFPAASRQLYELGYGDDRSNEQKETVAEYAQERQTRNIDQPISEQVKNIDIAEFLADEESDYAYLKSVKNNSV